MPIDCCTDGAQQQRRRSSTAVSSKGEQCHVYSRRRRLNTDLLYSATVLQRKSAKFSDNLPTVCYKTITARKKPQCYYIFWKINQKKGCKSCKRISRNFVVIIVNIQILQGSTVTQTSS